MFIKLHKKCQFLNNEIDLPSSKSESNRVLIINALSGDQLTLSNLSSARDTQTMIRLLAGDEKIWDVLDAGTTMRFLTAYAAISKSDQLLTGTARMQQRPIGVLGDALEELGAKISYENNVGYPPHRVTKIKEQQTNTLQIRGDISSQYISALLMLAPKLPLGLELELTGKVGSKPYITMTLSLMETFGVSHTWVDHKISIANQNYLSGAYAVESDWSGAAFWYSLCGLSGQSFQLNGLRNKSNQGDSVIVDIMSQLGVKSTFNAKGVFIEPIEVKSSLEWDFTDCPDLSMAVIPYCAAKGIDAKMTGLESLKIKESDRVLALQEQMAKFGGELTEEIHDELWMLDSSKRSFKDISEISIETYDDHRVAMGFAPLACFADVVIHDPEVVNKSYPEFWDHYRQLGIEITD